MAECRLIGCLYFLVFAHRPYVHVLFFCRRCHCHVVDGGWCGAGDHLGCSGAVHPGSQAQQPPCLCQWHRLGSTFQLPHLHFRSGSASSRSYVFVSVFSKLGAICVCLHICSSREATMTTTYPLKAVMCFVQPTTCLAQH